MLGLSKLTLLALTVAGQTLFLSGMVAVDSLPYVFGETVRLRAAWRNSDYLDAHIGKDGVEGCGELASPVANEDPELGHAIAEIQNEVADLLGSPSAIGDWWSRPTGVRTG